MDRKQCALPVLDGLLLGLLANRTIRVHPILEAAEFRI